MAPVQQFVNRQVQAEDDGGSQAVKDKDLCAAAADAGGVSSRRDLVELFMDLEGKNKNIYDLFSTLKAAEAERTRGVMR